MAWNREFSKDEIKMDKKHFFFYYSSHQGNLVVNKNYVAISSYHNQYDQNPKGNWQCVLAWVSLTGSVSGNRCSRYRNTTDWSTPSPSYTDSRHTPEWLHLTAELLAHLCLLLLYSQQPKAGNSLEVHQLSVDNENKVHLHNGMLFSC